MKPSCEGAYWTLGRAYFVTNRLEEGVQIASSAIAAAGDDYNVYIPFILMFERLERQDEALILRDKQTEVLERQLEMVPEDARARICLALNYVAQGNEATAMPHLKRAIGLRPNDTHMLYNAACLYGRLQRKKQALTTLKKAVAAGFKNADWAKEDPDLECLQDEPGFHRLLEEMRRSDKKTRTKKQTP